jgi:hypothetical protein
MPPSRIFGVLILWTGLAAQADDRLLVQFPAVLDPNASAHTAGSGCNVAEMVGKEVFQSVSRRNPGAGQIRDLSKAGDQKVLRLTVLSVDGMGGSIKDRSITVRTQLTRNEKTIRGGTLTGTFLSPYARTTCASLERIAHGLGRKVNGWLARGDAAEPSAEAAREQAGTPAE